MKRTPFDFNYYIRRMNEASALFSDADDDDEIEDDNIMADMEFSELMEPMLDYFDFTGKVNNLGFGGIITIGDKTFFIGKMTFAKHEWANPSFYLSTAPLLMRMVVGPKKIPSTYAAAKNYFYYKTFCQNNVDLGLDRGQLGTISEICEYIADRDIDAYTFKTQSFGSKGAFPYIYVSKDGGVIIIPNGAASGKNANDCLVIFTGFVDYSALDERRDTEKKDAEEILEQLQDVIEQYHRAKDALSDARKAINNFPHTCEKFKKLISPGETSSYWVESDEWGYEHKKFIEYLRKRYHL